MSVVPLQLSYFVPVHSDPQQYILDVTIFELTSGQVGSEWVRGSGRRADLQCRCAAPDDLQVGCHQVVQITLSLQESKIRTLSIISTTHRVNKKFPGVGQSRVYRAYLLAADGCHGYGGWRHTAFQGNSNMTRHLCRSRKVPLTSSWSWGNKSTGHSRL